MVSVSGGYALYASRVSLRIETRKKNRRKQRLCRPGGIVWSIPDTPGARMAARLETMQQSGIDTEFHVYPGLGHGFGLGTGTSAEGWLNDAAAFWEK